MPGHTIIDPHANPLLMAFVRAPISDQARHEAEARRLLGDVDQIKILDRAAQLWQRELVRCPDGCGAWRERRSVGGNEED